MDGHLSVVAGVRFVVELRSKEPAVFLSKLLGLLDHPGTALSCWSQNHLHAIHVMHSAAALIDIGVGIYIWWRVTRERQV